MQISYVANSAPTAALCATDILDAVPPVMWFIRCRMRRHRKGLSLPQFRTLARVDQRPSTCLSAVAEHLGSSLSGTSRIVAGLVDQGLLRRTECDRDRRQSALDITPRGRARLDTAYVAVRADLEIRFAQLPAVDRSKLIEATVVLRQIFGSMGMHDRIGPMASRVAAAPANARAASKNNRAPRHRPRATAAP